ncbi:MAG: FHA domain-containing protein [Blastocatellia bacterium]|jgi:hypothetical protein
MRQGFFDRLETWLRRLFERMGSAADFTLRRGDQPEVNFETLLPRIEREIEKSLREENGRLIAPHRIELRYNYETWTGMGAAHRERLRGELAGSLLEYICNRRYQVTGRLEVTIGYDAFTRGVEIRVSSDEPPAATGRREVRVSLAEQATGVRHSAILVSGAEPVGIGRNIANAIVINEPTISNFHAALVLRDSGVVELADRGGANGTAINGARLPGAGRGSVADGDLLRIGRVDCRLLIEDPK